MLVEKKLDIAIIKYTPIYRRCADLNYEVLFKERLYVILSKNHPLAQRGVIKLRELAGNLLITSDPSEYPHKMVTEILNRAGLQLEVHTHVNYANLSMIFDLVAQGLGISFASQYVYDYFMSEAVVKVALEEVYDYEVCLVTKNSDVNNQSLINYIRRAVKK